MPTPLKEYIRVQADRVDRALDRYLPSERAKPALLHKAMRYSLFAGGKRLRPVLCIASAQACGGTIPSALPAACAAECVHTYSLIHDDLPCMDDDDFRRGKPTCHKVFGEGVAVLAGDALLTIAFEILCSAKPAKPYGPADFARELARVSGSLYLVGGQVADLEGEGKKISPAELLYIHERKTSALLAGSMRLGAMSAGASPAQLKLISDAGYNLGMAFQVIDDILDATKTTEELGKTAGKDAAVQKATYPAILGMEKARSEADRFTRLAHRAIQKLGPPALRLQQLADYLLLRQN
ncbi:MAG: polyprenyl synthetase family protein [Verrucomicrobiae bacterium]|nr:polyprenyl synthetase family protein [Verrucomicrobiae bacterium]